MALVYIAALTYKRPEGLVHLLSGLRELKHPEGWDVQVLIVDNDPDGSARPFVPPDVLYKIELTPGIPHARNRALKEALDGGASLLCFLDDDEIPQADWLTTLVAHREATRAMLIGGPLRRTLPNHELSPLRRIFGKSLVARRNLAERRSANAARAGKPVPIYTSNWMCDLGIVRERGLWFDSDMLYSGGSDQAFYLSVLERGLPVSWCPSAIVTEPIEAHRLTLKYQYHRSRSQGIVLARLLDESAAQVYVQQVPRAVAGLILLGVPLLGLASFAIGLHLLGSAAGRFAYLRGKSSALYERREASG